MAEHPRRVVRVPGDRPGRSRLILLVPLRRDPVPGGRLVSRRRRLAFAVRAVRYRRGDLFRVRLGWHEARRAASRHASPDTALLMAALAPSGVPVDDLTPALPVLLARATLTAAPPASRAPVLAGAAALRFADLPRPLSVREITPHD